MEVVRVVSVEAEREIQEIRAMFVEYGQALNFNLCFQSFDDELRELPGAYAPPRGRLILSELDGHAAGCVAVKPLGRDICEMKRLYVRPQFRGRQLGAALVSRAMEEARCEAYRAMRLDTISGAMDPAIALYRSMGFREIAPYYQNPIPGALYFELNL